MKGFVFYKSFINVRFGYESNGGSSLSDRVKLSRYGVHWINTHNHTIRNKRFKENRYQRQVLPPQITGTHIE